MEFWIKFSTSLCRIHFHSQPPLEVSANFSQVKWHIQERISARNWYHNFIQFFFHFELSFLNFVLHPFRGIYKFHSTEAGEMVCTPKREIHFTIGVIVSRFISSISNFALNSFLRYWLISFEVGGGGGGQRYATPKSEFWVQYSSAWLCTHLKLFCTQTPEEVPLISLRVLKKQLKMQIPAQNWLWVRFRNEIRNLRSNSWLKLANISRGDWVQNWGMTVQDAYNRYQIMTPKWTQNLDLGVTYPQPSLSSPLRQRNLSISRERAEY